MDDAPLIEHAGLALRRMREADLPRVLDWRREPHVRATWDTDEDGDAIDEALIDAHYRPLIDPSQATVATIIEADGAPIGFLQMYRWAEEDADEARAIGVPFDDATWGLDLFVGDPRFVGRGVGPRAVDLACRWMFDAKGATRVAFLVAQDNPRARRAYEKAGFACGGEALDLDTRGGARIVSWIMVRDREKGEGRSC